MNRYAIYHVDGKYDGKELLEILEAESAGAAEEIMYNDGIDCSGSCFEDEDEEDGCEAECNCYYEAELVAPDTEIVDGRLSSVYEDYLKTIDKMQGVIQNYPRFIIEDEKQIELIQERIAHRKAKLANAFHFYDDIVNTAKEYIARMNINGGEYKNGEEI